MVLRIDPGCVKFDPDLADLGRFSTTRVQFVSPCMRCPWRRCLRSSGRCWRCSRLRSVVVAGRGGFGFLGRGIGACVPLGGCCVCAPWGLVLPWVFHRCVGRRLFVCGWVTFSGIRFTFRRARVVRRVMFRSGRAGRPWRWRICEGRPLSELFSAQLRWCGAGSTQFRRPVVRAYRAVLWPAFLLALVASHGGVAVLRRDSGCVGGATFVGASLVTAHGGVLVAD